MREDEASRYFEQRVDFHQLWAINAEMDAAVDDLRKKIEFHFDRRLCSTSELRYYKKKADDHANNLKRVFGKIHTHDYTLEHVLNLSRETYLKKVLKNAEPLESQFVKFETYLTRLAETMRGNLASYKKGGEEAIVQLTIRVTQTRTNPFMVESRAVLFFREFSGECRFLEESGTGEQFESDEERSQPKWPVYMGRFPEYAASAKQRRLLAAEEQRREIEAKAAEANEVFNKRMRL